MSNVNEITNDATDWLWQGDKRLPYVPARGYWEHRQDADVVSTDNGATYFRLSERPRYHKHGLVYASQASGGNL